MNFKYDWLKQYIYNQSTCICIPYFISIWNNNIFKYTNKDEKKRMKNLDVNSNKMDNIIVINKLALSAYRVSHGNRRSKREWAKGLQTLHSSEPLPSWSIRWSPALKLTTPPKDFQAIALARKLSEGKFDKNMVEIDEPVVKKAEMRPNRSMRHFLSRRCFENAEHLFFLQRRADFIESAAE